MLLTRYVTAGCAILAGRNILVRKTATDGESVVFAGRPSTVIHQRQCHKNTLIETWKKRNKRVSESGV
jgi:hypothetical protein